MPVLDLRGLYRAASPSKLSAKAAVLPLQSHPLDLGGLNSKIRNLCVKKYIPLHSSDIEAKPGEIIIRAMAFNPIALIVD
jgi:hypothetical protein